MPQPIAFGLPSDRGGKDLGIFMPIANGGWILSSTTPTIALAAAIVSASRPAPPFQPTRS